MSGKNLLKVLSVLLVLELIFVIIILNNSTSNSQTPLSLPTLVSIPIEVANSAEIDTENLEANTISDTLIEVSTDTPIDSVAEATIVADQSIDEADIPTSTSVPQVAPTIEENSTLGQVTVLQSSVDVPAQPVENQLIIRFNPAATIAERNAYIESIGATVSETIEVLDTVVVEVPQSFVELPASNLVAQSEEDYFVTALVDIANPPSDPHYAEQWALPAIGAPTMWVELADDMPQVTVAVIDSGVCFDHPDLQGRFLTGYDFVEDDAVAQDEFGHGCGVSGIIASNIDNGIGIAGVAPNAMILPVRVLNASGIGTYSDVSSGIVYAVDNGAEIINLSLGGSNHSALLEAAVNYAVEQGVIVVAAAGNTGDEVLYPAKYAPVIAVGSLDQDLQQSSFSANTADVDVWAPGRNIFVTDMNGEYSYFSGTSFAAPHMSGEIALSLSGESIEQVADNPNPTPAPETSDDIESGDTITGWVTVRHGDPRPDIDEAPIFEVNLVDEEGLTIVGLNLDYATARPFDGQRVEVITDASIINGQFNSVIDVVNIEIIESFAEAKLVGSKPFINVLCRFSDIASVPFQPNEYAALFSNVEPGLDHYWRQISYDNIDIAGTTTIPQWVDLPQPRSYYVNSATNTANLDLLAQDCSQAADSLVFFPNFFGINFMFNASLDCCAWGGTHFLTIDGQSKLYSTTWLPTWGQAHDIIAHEMGHAFGLPHSSGPADNPPAGLSIYVSQWDVMSASSGTCANDDASFGCWASGTIGYHLYLDDWIPTNRIITFDEVSQQTITLERLNQPVSATNPLLAIVEISPAHFYTVEARFNDSGYDGNVPGSAVIIHDVLVNRPGNTGPALVVDANDGNDNINDAGAMWTVGETYADTVNDITISIVSSGASSFTVDINKGGVYVAPEPTQAEVDALVDLYNSTNGTNWTDNTGWLIEPNACDWHGVFCDNDGHVYNLQLPINNLVGTIPSSIGDLTYLQFLSLYNNQLSGSIPPEIGNLVQLQNLYLSTNQLTESIPAQIGNLVLLQNFYLAENQLTGSIPTEIGNLSEMRILWFASNQLTGTIPSSIGNLTNLTYLGLWSNGLNGSIPSEIGNLSDLQFLYLDDNELGGSIPPEIGNLSNLVDLILNTNQLTDAIPSTLTNLSSLTYLDLWNNQLTGSIPAGLDTMSDLGYFNVGVNQLSGTIPSEIGNLSQLQTLYLANNQLSGNIPSELGSLANLQELYLSYNQFDGSIPSELGSLTNLEYMYLSGNQLNGTIPPAIANISSLIELILNENQLTGSIPTELGNLTNLNSLDLSLNALSGEIPQSITNLINLNTNAFDIVDFGYNRLTPSDPGVEDFLNAEDPDWEATQTLSPDFVEITDVTSSSLIVSWQAIQYTDDGGYYEVLLSETSGEPYDVNGCTTVDKTATSCEVTGLTTDTNYFAVVRTFTPAHDTQQNNLSSDFSAETSASTSPPSEYDALVALYNSTDGDNWFNNIGWLVDGDVCNWYGVTCNVGGNVTEINLASNYLIGTIPTSIGNLIDLTNLDLKDNGLSGNIPSEIGNLSNLVSLDLLSNGLSGSIPVSIGNLTNLQELNLSANGLSGSIPTAIGNLTNLQELDLSFNELNGTIPVEIGSLSNLRILFLAWNELTGTIPVEVAQIQTLEQVYLYVNQLSGTIPNEFTTLPNLLLLALEGNQLTGTIPIGFGNSPSLLGIGFSHNQLTGTIPSELGNSSTLQSIELDNNQLTGTIPNELANLDLTQLTLSDNQLTGTIPTWLGNQTNLGLLFLGGNQFTGELPSELGNLVNLIEMNVDRNALVGEIPQSITNLINLDAVPINNEIDFGFNGLYTSDVTVIAFLNDNDPGWSDTQTIAPSNIQVTASTEASITLSWDAIPYTVDGGYYEILLSETSGAPYEISGCTTVDKTETSCEVTGLTLDTTYFVVVRTFTPAHDTQQNDVLSGYSTEISASTNADNSLPAIPVVIAPSGLIVDTTPDLIWGVATNADLYDIYLSGPSSFTPILETLAEGDVCNLTTDECTYSSTNFTSGLPIGNYAFFVRGRTQSAQISEWSPAAQFQIGPPTQPYLTAPSGTITENPPTIAWTQADSATSYDLYLTGGAYSHLWTVDNDTSCSDGNCSTQALDTLSAGVYAVFVRARNSIGVTNWSPQYTFSIAPDAPIMDSPIGILTIFRPDYVWQLVPDAPQYSVYITGPGTNIFRTYEAIDVCDSGTGLCTINPGDDLNQDLQYGVHAAWVQSRAGSAKSPWSNSVVFTIAPDVPQLTAPSNPTSNVLPTYIWSAITGATGYDLYVVGPGTSIYETYDSATYCVLSVCNVTPSVVLGDGIYGAYIRSRNGNTRGEWSAQWQFEVNTVGGLSIQEDETVTPLPSETTIATEISSTTETALPSITETPLVSETPLASTTPLPTETELSTETPLPSETPLASATPLASTTPVMTETPLPSATPLPTETSLPSTTATSVTETP